jgi:hypothetical protein
VLAQIEHAGEARGRLARLVPEVCARRDFRSGVISDRFSMSLDVRYASDCVAKLFLGVRTKFSRGAGALILKSCRGSYDQSDFQPAAFVSSLQGITSQKTRFDGHAAKFCRHLIFEFCNTIGVIATVCEEQLIALSLCTRARYSDTGSISIRLFFGAREVEFFVHRIDN